MADKAPEACLNCKFWDVYPGEIGDQVGDCRRNPPTLNGHALAALSTHFQLSESLMDPANLYTASAFPATHQTSWCGHYQEI